MPTVGRRSYCCRRACFLAAPGRSAAIEIARDGKSAYVIVVADDANDVARHAARELQDHLKQVTGGRAADRERIRRSPAAMRRRSSSAKRS